MKKLQALSLLGVLLLAVGALRADSIHIQNGAQLNGLGSFTGVVTYQIFDQFDATLSITLMNTSPAGNGGVLSGLVFNNPFGLIDGLAMTPAGQFQNLTGPIPASPFGCYDFGASLGGDWEAGGNPVFGTHPGSSQTFSWSLSGTNMQTLNAADFVLNTGSSPCGGQGPSGFDMAVRFTSFNDGGDDKVLTVLQTSPTPEPASLVMMGSGLLGLAGIARRRFR